MFLALDMQVYFDELHYIDTTKFEGLFSDI